MLRLKHYVIFRNLNLDQIDSFCNFFSRYDVELTDIFVKSFASKRRISKALATSSFSQAPISCQCAHSADGSIFQVNLQAVLFAVLFARIDQ